MKTIWKFPIRHLADRIVIDMPRGAAPLRVQMQNGTPYMWAVVDTAEPTEPTGFRILGTGRAISRDVGQYIDTLQMPGSGLVWHVFEECESEPTP